MVYQSGQQYRLDVRVEARCRPLTVFASRDNGMSVVDATRRCPGLMRAFLSRTAVRNYTSPNPVRVPNLVSISGIAQISPLSFSAVSDNAM